MNASMSTRPARVGGVERALDACAAAASAASRTARACRPPARAIDQSTCMRVGQRDVDGVDLGVGEQRLVGAVRARDAVLVGVRLRARPRSRLRDGDDLDAVRRAARRARCAALMRAVERSPTPQPHEPSPIGRNSWSGSACVARAREREETTSATSSALIIPSSSACSGVAPGAHREVRRDAARGRCSCSARPARAARGRARA